MEKISIGDQISSARKHIGISQEELALECNLHIKTIQRIESGELMPRLYTLRLINDVLGTNFAMHKKKNLMEEEILELRKIFRRRRRIRLIIAFTAIILMIAVLLLAYPSWRLFGLHKNIWAPYFYLVMFALLIGIALIWKCPGCNALLGDIFNTKYCSKCGLKFYD